jgi:hypothetical protein
VRAGVDRLDSKIVWIDALGLRVALGEHEKPRKAVEWDSGILLRAP